MKISTLGPKGTFSHEAASGFNQEAEIVFEKTIYDVMDSVSKKETDFGIVPIENSVGGTVGLTLDALMDFNLAIKAEEIIPIRHNLASFEKSAEIKKIYANPETYAQCEGYIRKNYPGAEIVSTSSNGKSAQIISERKSKKEAAIVPDLAIKVYKLNTIVKSIQDSKFNVTRFVVLSLKNGTKPTGYDRTSISIYPQIDNPGLLHDLIGEFSKRKINLSKIESRPAKGKLGDYIFFIDLEGHVLEDNVAEAINAVEKSAFVKVFGSYQRKY